jgi:uncharacterized BrkB/YihY/UPF0761 family membrane protein
MHHWFPNLSSWFKATLLTLLMAGLEVGIVTIWQVISFLINWSHRLGTSAVVLVLLSPVAMIAITHHWLHLLLDRFFPETRSPDLGTPQGVLPDLMSWWEGLYGWLVSILSMVISFAVLSAVLPSVNSFDHWLHVGGRIQDFLMGPTLLRIGIAAYLYHFEYSVQRHLIKLGATHQ